MDNLLTWIIFGITAGIAAWIIDTNRNATSLLGTLTLGVLGSVVGGLLADLVFYGGESTLGFSIVSFIVAVVGASFLLFISKLFREV